MNECAMTDGYADAMGNKPHKTTAKGRENFGVQQSYGGWLLK